MFHDLFHHLEKDVPQFKAINEVKLAVDKWSRPYSHGAASFPSPGLRDFKFCPAIGCVGNGFDGSPQSAPVRGWKRLRNNSKLSMILYWLGRRFGPNK